MNLVSLVQLLERAEGTNLSTAISWVQEERADPKDLHYYKITLLVAGFDPFVVL